jgi:hypothetical protein
MDSFLRCLLPETHLLFHCFIVHFGFSLLVVARPLISSHLEVIALSCARVTSVCVANDWFAIR